MKITQDLFGTEIKENDLIIVTAFQGRNPSTMVGRVKSISQKTSFDGLGQAVYTSHTVSFFKIDNPDRYANEYGKAECGRTVKSGNPDRIVIANHLPKAVDFARKYETVCQEIQVKVAEKKQAEKEKRDAEKAREQHLANLKWKRNQKKAAERKAILAKLTPAERKLLKACAK